MLILLALPAFSAPTCKSTQALTAQEGTFTDGSEASAHYSNGLNLCWKIAPSCPEKARVTVWFERMEVETGYDFVQVFDAEETLLSKAATAHSTFTGAGFIVWFSTDESTTDEGFTARYSCESLDGEESEISEEDTLLKE